ncbi:SIR2 family protein [Halobacillus sp. B23F22_1]|uniref:SIR2 family protein n=1 Tax=Halobacillus sp. B23F22_1 TaxID=3459514 RepID=UPI00373EA7B3
MVDIEEELIEHLKNINTAPFLFVGSGFSRRYIDLENWEGLLRKFSDLVPQEFDYYSSTSSGEWAKAAGMMAEDFHPIWWSDSKYEESRDEFRGRINAKHSPLKIEISKYLRNLNYSYGLDKIKDTEINELKNIVIDGIITTNWDMLLEQIFPDMEMYIGQKELLFSQPLEVNEIYKIHGCSSTPDSLVLTNNDYSDYNEKNAYLAAKLLTIFIEHPIIFIGYSLTDSNIHKILKSITACLDDDNADKLKDRLIFVERSKGQPDSFVSSSLTINQLTIPITRVKTDRFDLVYKALSKNKRKYSLKLMRSIKSQIYDLVKTNDPHESIHVIDHEDNQNAENVEFVIGVGVKSVAQQMEANSELSSTVELSEKGYVTITQFDLFREILFDEPNYDYNIIVQETLPEKLKLYQTIPVNKYVLLSNIDESELDHKIKKKLNLEYSDFLTKAQKEKLDDLAFQWQFRSIKELIDGYPDFEKAIQYIPLLGVENLDPKELKDFLADNIKLLERKDVVGSSIRKLFRIYDWLAYGNEKNF